MRKNSLVVTLMALIATIADFPGFNCLLAKLMSKVVYRSLLVLHSKPCYFDDLSKTKLCLQAYFEINF